MAAKSKELTEQQQKAQARNAAARRLAENHPDEFRRLMIEEHEKRGVTYSPRLSPEEKARKQVEALFAEFPGLKDEVPF